MFHSFQSRKRLQCIHPLVRHVHGTMRTIQHGAFVARLADAFYAALLVNACKIHSREVVTVAVDVLLLWRWDSLLPFNQTLIANCFPSSGQRKQRRLISQCPGKFRGGRVPAEYILWVSMALVHLFMRSTPILCSLVWSSLRHAAADGRLMINLRYSVLSSRWESNVHS